MTKRLTVKSTNRLKLVLRAVPTMIFWHIWKSRIKMNFGGIVNWKRVIFEVSKSIHFLCLNLYPWMKDIPKNGLLWWITCRIIGLFLRLCKCAGNYLVRDCLIVILMGHKEVTPVKALLAFVLGTMMVRYSMLCANKLRILLVCMLKHLL